MKMQLLLSVVFEILRNLVRIFLEVLILSLFSINSVSESSVYLHVYAHASVAAVIEKFIVHPFILSVIALSIIDIKFAYPQALQKETRLSGSKLILASELPHIVLKALVMIWADVHFFGILGMASGIGVLAFYLFDRIQSVAEVFSLIFGRNDSLIFPAKLIKWGLGILICAVLILPTLWIGAEWFTQGKLQIDCLIILPVLNVFILKSLFRILKSERRDFENLE
jgi:hypothetical protein